MNKHSERDEWLRDIEARQRNVVFPDTANNTARFWRNITEGRRPLTVLQKIGVTVFALMICGLVLSIFLGQTLWNPVHPGFTRANILNAGLQWLIAFGVIGGFLLVVYLSGRRKQLSKRSNQGRSE